MKSIARYTVVVLVTLSVLMVLWQIRQVVVLFLFSLAAAAAFRPLVDYFAARGLPRGIALLLAYGLVVVSGATLLLVMTGPLVHDLEQASNHFVSAYQQSVTAWSNSRLGVLRSLAMLLPPPQKLFAGMTDQGGAWMVQAVLGVTTNVVAFGGSLGIILALSLYWSVDSLYFERLLLSLTPVEQRPQARLIWQGIEKGLGAYIRSELTQSLLAGILLWLGYRLMGLDYPVLLAFVGALVWFIPWFGAILAMILPFLTGLSSGVVLAVIAALYTLAVLVVQEFIIEPRIFRRQGYSSVVLVLVALVLAGMFGLLGWVLAPLVSATLQIVLKYVVQSPVAVASSRLSTNEEAVEGVEALQRHLAATRETMMSREIPAYPEIANLADRLDQLIADTRRYLD